MLTTTRFSLLAACALSAASLTACSDKNDAPAPLDPDPKPTFELSHYFDVTSPAPGGGTAHSGGGMAHAPQDIAGAARLNAPGHVLVLSFKAKPDEVYMEVDQTQLRPGWAGTYALRCRTRPTDPVFVSYLHTAASTGFTAIMRLSDGTPQLTGYVTIAAYDAKRQLLSGSYEVTAPDQQDPSAPANAGSPRCTVLLAGKFTNLKVQP
jgi:hypothetical protein